MPMPANMGRLNAYVIEGPETVGMVDTGMADPPSRKVLTDELAALGYGLSDVDRVVCTHHHVDHAGLGARLQAHGAQIVLSEKDSRDLDRFFNEAHLDPERAAFYGRHPIEPIFQERACKLFGFFRTLAEPFAADSTIDKDRETVEIGGRSFEAWFTPGHTDGHLCLVHHAERIVLTGDHLIKAHPTHVSLRRDATGTDPMSDFFKSLRRLTALDDYTAHAGHGSPFTNLATHVQRMIDAHQAKLNRFTEALTDEPVSAFELVQKVMAPGSKIFAQWLAMSQSLAYLQHLVATGQAREELTGEMIYYTRA